MRRARVKIHPGDWTDPLNRALILDDLREYISCALGPELQPEDVGEAELVINGTRVDLSVRLAPETAWFDVDLLPGKPMGR